MKKMILLCLFLFSCAKLSNDQVMIKDADFDNVLSFEEFKLKVIDYAKNSDYPNLN